jgi:hypothetical protein
MVTPARMQRKPRRSSSSKSGFVEAHAEAFAPGGLGEIDRGFAGPVVGGACLPAGGAAEAEDGARFVGRGEPGVDRAVALELRGDVFDRIGREREVGGGALDGVVGDRGDRWDVGGLGWPDGDVHAGSLAQRIGGAVRSRSGLEWIVVGQSTWTFGP